MEYFILSYIWCLLNTIFKWLGIYPCQRRGQSSLNVTSACAFWVRFIVMFFLVMGTLWMAYVYLIFEETSPTEMMNQVDIIILPKVIDKIAIGGNIVLLSTMFLITVVKLRSMAADLVEIQDFVNQNARLTLDEIRASMIKCYVRLVPLVIIIIGTYTSIFYGMFYDLQPLLGLSTIGTTINICCMSFGTIFQVLPLFYFILVYVEVCVVMQNWCNTLTNQGDVLKIIEESKIFLKGLKMASKMFSPYLFWITSLLFLSSIINAYMALAQAFKLSNDELKLGSMILLMGQYFCCLFNTYLIFILGDTSEKTQLNVQELKSSIQDAYYQTNKADCICSMLGEFQGFDANGYFTLNHSTLTGMTANFATFLVILVQFNQSEPSKPDQLA